MTEHVRQVHNPGLVIAVLVCSWVLMMLFEHYRGVGEAGKVIQKKRPPVYSRGLCGYWRVVGWGVEDF